jgi:proteic killer suppression protein
MTSARQASRSEIGEIGVRAEDRISAAASRCCRALIEPPAAAPAFDICTQTAYSILVIKSFKSKPLSDLWSTGKTAKIDGRMYKRILLRLEQMDAAETVEDLTLPGFNFHGLRGFVPKRYSIHVNGPWCITFEFNDGDALNIDFEQYH